MARESGGNLFLVDTILKINGKYKGVYGHVVLWYAVKQEEL